MRSTTYVIPFRLREGFGESKHTSLSRYSWPIHTWNVWSTPGQATWSFVIEWLVSLSNRTESYQVTI